jgi:hypothetical protein
MFGQHERLNSNQALCEVRNLGFSAGFAPIGEEMTDANYKNLGKDLCKWRIGDLNP